MVALRIIQNTVAAPSLLPDTVWDGYVGDWHPARADEPSNFGGLRARAPLETAIILCLMSDARARPGDVIPDGSGDPRGWPGDMVDPSIAPLGSRLWLLRRRELTQEVADLAVLYAREALQTLVDQRAVASVEVSGEPNFALGRLDLAIRLFKSDGTFETNRNYSLLWDKNRDVQYPLDK